MTTQGGHAPRNSELRKAIDRAIRAQGIVLPPDPPATLPWQAKGAIATAKKKSARLEAELRQTKRDLKAARRRVAELERQVDRILRPPAHLLRRVA